MTHQNLLDAAKSMLTFPAINAYIKKEDLKSLIFHVRKLNKKKGKPNPK